MLLPKPTRKGEHSPPDQEGRMDAYLGPFTPAYNALANRIHHELTTTEDEEWMEGQGLNTTPSPQEFEQWCKERFRRMVGRAETDLFPPPVRRSETIGYTDGGEREGEGGFGFIVLDVQTQRKEVVNVWAPVELDDTAVMFLGADRHSNTTGELSAMAEIFLYWLFSDPLQVPCHLYYDSQIACDVAEGRCSVSTCPRLSRLVRTLQRRLEAKRGIRMTHVFSHVGYKYNERADVMATRGLHRKRVCKAHNTRFAAEARPWRALQLLDDHQYGALEAEPTQTLTLEFETMVEALSSAASEELPDKEAAPRTKRAQSDATKELRAERAAKAATLTKEERKELNKAIGRSGRNDYREYVNEVTDRIEEADKKGNAKLVSQLYNQLAGARRRTATRPLKDENDALYTDAAQRLGDWAKMMGPRFAKAACDGDEEPTDIAEDDLPEQAFSFEEFEQCINAMKKNKAPGMDGLPVEVYQKSPEAKGALFRLCQRIWEEEAVPEGFVTGMMHMVHKAGEQSDMWNYRPICLLSHAYKCLSTLLLHRMRPAIERFLPDLQDGFRATRGCRNATTITHALMERCTAEGRHAIVTFVDYKDAFSTISHTFLDECLEAAGVSAKIRRLIRVIMRAAKCVVVERNAEGKLEHSPPFEINRGVLQGDIFSPACFIVGLAVLFQECELTECDCEAKQGGG